MEVRVKTGEDLTCEYTGDECGELIKIYGDGDVETKWIGRGALQNALEILNSVSRTSAQAWATKINENMEAGYQPYSPAFQTTLHPQQLVQQQPPESRYQAPPQEVVPQVQFPGRNPKDPPEMVKQFDGALAELVANPPKSRENESEGVPEAAIRVLMKQFKPAFRNPNSMFNSLRKHVGMSRERFETIMEGV